MWFCSALTSSGSNGAQRPVVPKVPLRVARPARPAICANSDGRQAAELIAVVFAVGGEGHVIDVEIEAHSDRVGGDEDSRRRRTGTSRPARCGCAATASPAHGSATVLAPDQFGDGVNFVGGERDDGGAARLPRDLAVAGEFAACDSRGRVTMLAPGSSRSMIGRMVAAPSSSVSSRPRRLQNAVGEDVAALEVRRDLDFIDGQKRHVEIRGIASTVETQ